MLVDERILSLAKTQRLQARSLATGGRASVSADRARFP